jgi:hypothetical protein
MNQSTTEIASGAVRDIDGSVMKKPGAMASQHRRHHFHRRWLPSRFSWADCRTDLNRLAISAVKKDGLAVRAALSIAHYETKTCAFARPYLVCLVSGFQRR